MFFLLRMAFWLTIVCVLLPGTGEKTQSPEAKIDAVQAMTFAGAAVSDMRGVCERNAEACVVGGKVATAIGHRAEAGARTIIEFVSNQIADNKAAPVEEPARIAGVSTTGALGTSINHGTLTPTDMKPAWHAPVPLPPRREARAGRPSA